MLKTLRNSTHPRTHTHPHSHPSCEDPCDSFAPSASSCNGKHGRTRRVAAEPEFPDLEMAQEKPIELQEFWWVHRAIGCYLESQQPPSHEAEISRSQLLENWLNLGCRRLFTFSQPELYGTTAEPRMLHKALENTTIRAFNSELQGLQCGVCRQADSQDLFAFRSWASIQSGCHTCSAKLRGSLKRVIVRTRNLCVRKP